MLSSRQPLPLPIHQKSSHLSHFEDGDSILVRVTEERGKPLTQRGSAPALCCGCRGNPFSQTGCFGDFWVWSPGLQYIDHLQGLPHSFPGSRPPD